MPDNLHRVPITIIAIALLVGCGPVNATQGNEPVSDLSTIPPGTGPVSPTTAEGVILVRTLTGHSGSVLDVVFSARGRYLASSGQDMSIKLWDIDSGHELHTFQMTSVDMSDIDISMDGSMLASGEAVWDLASMQETRVLERGSVFPASVAFSPDGSLLALGLFDQQITLWSVASGHPVRTLERREENRTKRMEFSPDGTLLAAGVIDGTVRLFDVATGGIVGTLEYAAETDIHDLAFSPDGSYLATGGRVPAVVLWDVASGKVVRTFRLTDNAISMAFSPDGTILATAGGYEHEARLWDVESGKVLHSLPHSDQLTSVAFSPDGRLLAVGCFDGHVYLWGIPTGP